MNSLVRDGLTAGGMGEVVGGGGSGRGEVGFREAVVVKNEQAM